MYQVEIYTNPMASPRPRFRKIGKHGQSYMPASYTNHKKELQKEMPALKLDSSLNVCIDFHFPLLSSWSKKKQKEMAGQYKPTKPDIDNLIKTVLDAGNGVLWVDDNRVTEVHSKKVFSEVPKIVINIEELEVKE